MVATPDHVFARRATPEDADELTRLRVLMFGDMGHEGLPMDAQWRERNVEHFRARLLDRDTFAAFVVDKPDWGLAACAVGWLNPHLVGLRDLSGRTGYIANMSTEPDYRRRGYGRATLLALLEWMRSTGIGRVNLHASADGEKLYRSLGFIDPQEPALTLRL
ncbi:MAG: GNAT family N-acetyltransferase [Acidimicrobiales bacterium]